MNDTTPTRLHRRHPAERRQDHRLARPDRRACRSIFPRVGYIKPVGQRFVEIEEQKIDEDTVLMDSVYQLELSAGGHEPDRRRAGFHAKISPVGEQRRAGPENQKGVRPRRLGKGFRAVRRLRPRRRRFGVRSVQCAGRQNLLGAKVIIVTQGGIGKPIDEVALNQALFEKEGVEIIGVILNKVLGEKVD